ncbi:hypothetical protein CRG98_022574, partial [Punica granatum]
MATTNQLKVVIDETRTKSKKQKESSRDPLSSLEGRMTKIEVVMADIQGKTEDASKGMEELRSDFEELQEGFMKTYFRATGVEDDVVRVGMVSMYLVDVALLWWRRRCDDRSGKTVNTWEEFKTKFRQQLYLEYAKDEARAKLRHFEYKGKLREYVRQFTELMLQIPSLTDKEAFFQFMDVLKLWAKQELQRRGMQDLHKSMSTAESLVEFRSSSKSDSKEKGKPKDTRASNLFISEEGAKKLGLRVAKTRGRLKTVNSEEVPTCRVAKDMDIRIGQWSGNETIEVIPLDDYDFVIGMDFLDRINALLVPFVDCICVLDAMCQCVVP